MTYATTIATFTAVSAVTAASFRPFAKQFKSSEVALNSLLNSAAITAHVHVCVLVRNVYAAHLSQ